MHVLHTFKWRFSEMSVAHKIHFHVGVNLMILLLIPYGKLLQLLITVSLTHKEEVSF